MEEFKQDHNDIKELLDFIDHSPTAFHVVSNIMDQLDAAGFIQLSEREKWNLKPGMKGYVVRNLSSVIAFTLPEQTQVSGFQMLAAHSDSPSFKIKENATSCQEQQYVKLNVEKYGGMIPATWLDRPLSVAGRVSVLREGRLEEELVNLDQDLFLIPSLAIHMTRGATDAPLAIQTDLQPLAGMKAEYGDEDKQNALLRMIAQQVKSKPEDVLGTDLFLYNRQKGCVLGMNGELIAAPRLDDQECVFAGLKAFLTAECTQSGRENVSQMINVYAVFDNEEVGSLTRQGADSDFLGCTLQNIMEGVGLSQGDYRRILAGSFLLSADNAHAVHPNHPEKADPTNRPYLNGGVVIKYHGGQKYTTDACSGAVVKKLCMEQGISYQTYHNHSDIAGGSTLGNIALSSVSVRAADIGLPQLAMHSAYETAGAKDVSDLIRLITAYYRQ